MPYVSTIMVWNYVKNVTSYSWLYKLTQLFFLTLGIFLHSLTCFSYTQSCLSKHKVIFQCHIVFELHWCHVRTVAPKTRKKRTSLISLTMLPRPTKVMLKVFFSLLSFQKGPSTHPTKCHVSAIKSMIGWYLAPTLECNIIELIV